MMKITPDDIDALLPQTQCTLCGYAGCLPYAEAILYKRESIDKCLPGGVEVLMRLGALMHVDPAPFVEAMKEKAKLPERAVIDESACIGCKKCIQVCPVDAILGASKQMHSVIQDECTGCELCVPVCPVDCIDMVPMPPLMDEEKIEKAQHAKARYEFRQMRLQRAKMAAAQKHRKMKFGDMKDQKSQLTARQQEIRAAVDRQRKRKNGR